ncbi:unnamed protein product, partial [Mesorhabditis belari]|uniref:Abnormal cell migration protein 18-like fibronectin type I domain-containing protein n=1 Tax=Mesorhabditis belari TaxID=2138241 RepID=A0AAF3EC00_9BILA
MLKILAFFVFLLVAHGCRHKGNVYSNGETWDENNAFRMRCDIDSNGGWKTAVVGCLVNGNLVKVGEKKTIGDIVHHCDRQSNGQISIRHTKSATAACVDADGKRHSVGDKWVQRTHFEMLCEPEGNTKFVGCVAEGQHLGPNSSRTIHGVQHHCDSKVDGTFRYYTGPKQ